MREMKSSGIEWIGKVPKSWDVEKLKYSFEKHFGGAWGLSAGQGETDSICVRVADFNYPHLSVNYNDNMTIRSYDNKVIESFSIVDGDILLEKSGGGEQTPVGRSVLHKGKNAMCANFIECLRPNEDNDSRFLNYWLYSSYQNGYSKRNIKQTTGIQNLDITALLSETIAVPVIDEQIAIADYLDEKCADIDKIIATKKKTNELLKERRQSIITEAVTKGLNPNAEMKDSGIDWIGKIPVSWNVERLIGYFKFGKGLSITKNDLSEDGVSVISYGQIHSKNNSFSKVENELIRYVSKDYLNANSASLVKKGDFIFADTSEDVDGSGNFVYIDDDYEMFAGYHTVILKSKISRDNRYYAYLFQTNAWRSQIRSIVSGVKLFSITQGILKGTTLLVPNVEEQVEIANNLDNICTEIDRLIKSNNKTIEKLQEYRKSLIYEAVTGKIEIN